MTDQIKSVFVIQLKICFRLWQQFEKGYKTRRRLVMCSCLWKSKHTVPTFSYHSSVKGEVCVYLMRLFWLWISCVAWRAWRKGSSEPYCSPRTEGTAGTQHPCYARSTQHSNAQGQREVFSFGPHGLACLLHVAAEAAVSGDSLCLFIPSAPL